MSDPTTTTTTSPTTTTTTTPTALNSVKTIYYELSGDKVVKTETSDASDNSQTINTDTAKSISFGTIAPKEKSKNIIVALNVPKTRAITNIKIGLISTGGITFSTTTFGISKSIEIRDDITPSEYFQGVNSNKSSTSVYNIAVNNRDKYSSEYIYLNTILPADHVFGTGIIKYKWWFDYDE